MSGKAGLALATLDALADVIGLDIVTNNAPSEKGKK